MSADRESLQVIIHDVIVPSARHVDTTGEFPREGIDQLAAAGFLGMMSAGDLGGGGKTLSDAAATIEAVAGACGSTAMILLMHFAGTAIIEAYGEKSTRRAVAEGSHLTTLAFSELGSRSHFWSPLGTARRDGDDARLTAQKSWVTSAGHADSYVWSSKPVDVEGPMSLWLVPASTEGLYIGQEFDGFGLRGNASRPIAAKDAPVRLSTMLGADGAGLDIALQTALPQFLVLSAAFSLGLMRALVASAADHLKESRLIHLDQTLADQQSLRTHFARLLTRTDEVGVFLDDTLDALTTGRDDAVQRVLQVKAVAAEAAADVSDGVMQLCGGSAFRKEFGVERRFRDSRAARVMAPTTEALRDFVGRAALGLPLF
jgi:isovaleryl-CoA dehydrogenase